MNENTPPDADRLFQDVLANLNWKGDAATIAKKVQQLDRGLPSEDEFSVVCSWLGKCRLIHKLDQQQVPVGSSGEFQVPDLLAFFNSQHFTSPVLIEVKTSIKMTLSFTPEYFLRLRTYAALLNLPLLIAWKFHGVWCLFEVCHLKKAISNFNISFENAMKENLLGILAGDVAYKIGAGVGIHFKFRKDRMIDEEDIENTTTQTWQTTIEEAFYTDYTGETRDDLGGDVASLLMISNLEKNERHVDTHIHISYTTHERHEMQFAHSALVQLLLWEFPEREKLHWRRLLREEKLTSNISKFSAALETAFNKKIVSHILHQQPQTMPVS